MTSFVCSMRATELRVLRVAAVACVCGAILVARLAGQEPAAALEFRAGAHAIDVTPTPQDGCWPTKTPLPTPTEPTTSVTLSTVGTQAPAISPLQIILLVGIAALGAVVLIVASRLMKEDGGSD